MTFAYTKEQKYVIDQVVKNVKKKQQISIGGVAGSGKTEVIRSLLEHLPGFVPCAFTGKATEVLRKKGMEASTIHSLIYIPEPQKDGTVVFNRRESVVHAGFVVDEASTVNNELYEDLRWFGKPIIFVGDHGQLEPIGNNPNLMKNPDYRLETVHRNAGEIAHFAEWIRLGKNVNAFSSEGKVTIIPNHQKSYKVTNQMLKDADQIIVAYNATRSDKNRIVRNLYGYEGTVQVGEKVICLKNNKLLGLFNGMQGIVTKVYKYNAFDFVSEGRSFEKVSYHPKTFGLDKVPQEMMAENFNPFDYGYCVTAHKSQGDQFDKVLVYEQVCKNWEHQRWSYTVASRAKKMLVWVAAGIRREYDGGDWF